MSAIVRVTKNPGQLDGPTKGAIERRARKMLVELGLDDVELSIGLIDDPAIQALNRDYRQKDKPTDVLAFAMREAGSSPPQRGEPELLGDVLISLETAARQARAHRRTVLEEVTMLLAHGLLHLLGYDHQTDEEEREMKAETARLEAAATRRQGANSQAR